MNRNFRMWHVVGIIVMALAMALPAAAQEDASRRTVTVTGFGSASGTPDIAYVSLGVQFNDADPTTAFNRVSSGIAAVREALLALDIAERDLQTSGFNMWVQEMYDPSGAATGSRTYNATNMLNIAVRDIAQVGDVITTGINAGANMINSLNFSISDPSGLAQEARVAAVADARARAEQLARLLGLTIGEVLSIDESVQGGALPETRLAIGAGMGAGGSISEGTLSINVMVTITFSAR